jgi:hypothetical protein
VVSHIIKVNYGAPYLWRKVLIIMMESKYSFYLSIISIEGEPIVHTSEPIMMVV